MKKKPAPLPPCIHRVRYPVSVYRTCQLFDFISKEERDSFCLVCTAIKK